MALPGCHPQAALHGPCPLVVAAVVYHRRLTVPLLRPRQSPACLPACPPCSTLGLYGTCRVWALGGAGGEPALNEAEKQDGLNSFLDAAAAAVELSQGDPNLNAEQRAAVAQVGRAGGPQVDGSCAPAGICFHVPAAVAAALCRCFG